MSPHSPRERHEPEEPFIRGHYLVSRVEYLRRRHAPDGIARVLARLAPSDCEYLQELAPVAWYPFALLDRLDRAIGEEFAPGDPSLYEELGSWSARQHTTWLGDDAAHVSVHAFLSRLAEGHRRYHSFGGAQYVRQGFNGGELCCYDYPRPEITFCRSAVGFLRHCIRILSGPGVQVQETGCQCRGEPACIFVMRWESERSVSADPA
jgi:hypothetical protein